VFGGLDGISRRLRNAWFGLAARERGLLGLLGLVALSLTVVMAADWSGRQRETNALARAELDARQEAALRGARRPDMAEAARLRAISEQAFTGEDIWMARVAVEQHLATLAAEAGVTEPRIRIAEDAEGDAAAPVLKAEISAPYDGAAIVRLLQRLASDRRAGFVDAVSADRGESAEFRIALPFPVRIVRRGEGP